MTQLDIPPSTHVACEDEMYGLPAFFQANDQTLMQEGLETVWLVNDHTGQFEGGFLVNTYTSMYFTFTLVQLPGEDLPHLIATSEWLPCEDPEGGE